jgi:hypothetical protein
MQVLRLRPGTPGLAQDDNRFLIAQEDLNV